MLVPVVAFSEGEMDRYITRSHLNTVAPEIANATATRVNAEDGLTLKSLRGRLVLLLFTSVG